MAERLLSVQWLHLLMLKQGQQQRSISQIHLPSWEDNTGPGDVANFLQFVRFVREKLARRGGPVVVHCRYRYCCRVLHRHYYYIGHYYSNASYSGNQFI